jgi:hypothetical protein
MPRMLPKNLLCCWLALACAAGAQSIATNSPGGAPLSDRIVHYTIEAKYDAKTHTLDGSETLVYQNKTGQPLDTFPFHLYLNAFQPQSTWMRETHRDGNLVTRFRGGADEKSRGEITIKQFTVDGAGDLTQQLKFIAPDDGNGEDKTVTQVKLPKAVAPGASVTFRIQFHDKFPETVARTGWYREFIMGAQWFPKVGVWWHGAWNCHQFHASTEFFADFGVYDVKLTLPDNFVTGASGVETASVKNPDHTQTVTWHGEDIHDFAWTASPHFVVGEQMFQGSMGPVKIRALVHASHSNQVQRYLTATSETMKRFDKWYGPYPYKQITVVDPEPGSDAGGMEYPTLFTGGTAWFIPEKVYALETVTEHEFGHQYWYAMVATNEFEEAWLDEGINQYTEGKVLGDWLGNQTSLYNQLHATAGDADFSRLEYIISADTDPMIRFAWQYMTGGSYGSITYGKTATVLLTLEGVIGEDKVREALRVWFTRYRFTHPTGEDFMRTLQEVAGQQDLKWFFDAAIRGTQVLDYDIRGIHSEPVEYWKEDGKPKEIMWRNFVLVHRKGDFVFPVDVAIKFDNGETVRERWDGRDRWIRYTYDRKGARVTSAEVDPDHKVWLDRDRYNNSRTDEPDRTAAHKLAQYWAFLNEMAAQALMWLF